MGDLVDDSDAAKRSRVLSALKDPAHKNDRDHVDVIIALGMAKEGFDWIWCEHALTIGYRSSLTEIVQIIGRATRDAKGKERSRFTNLIAEPTAEQSAVAEAVNDMLKAISASLLMEQVLAPRYEFTPKNAGPQEGFDYGDEGYKEGGHNIGVNKDTGQIHLEIAGLTKPETPEANHSTTCEAVVERGVNGSFVLACRQRVNNLPWVYQIPENFPGYEVGTPEKLFRHELPEGVWPTGRTQDV